ncbi:MULTISPECIES: site-specific integrase [unclassified Pseudomonas]|uniref:site-specific integrase n=1 Tax=unclassified Pseudomonas TaxID=196821 RepID=UPI0024572827|nr:MULTISPECIES: site-specific integrase [unclassified Pseudomonas]
MTEKVDRYRQAARRESTERRYQQALAHFEETWGGFLPASSEAIARYLADYAETLASSTLRANLAALASSTLRANLAALAKWHLSQGFPDPTKAPQVREVLRGIQALHPRLERQAEPLQLSELTCCIDWLVAQEQLEPGNLLRCRRDRALILLGFWRAFRSDDLCRLRVEFIDARPGEGLELLLPSSKGDRDNQGQVFTVPALKRLCPVEAYLDWLAVSGLQQGPVFRALDRWGHLADTGLHPYSVSRILRRVLVRSGLEGSRFSSHSLRRGFATWASRNQWSAKALMSYVGWRDAKAALRYVEPEMPFGELRR